MSDPIVGLLGFCVSLGLIAFGMPVAVSLGAVGIAGYALLNGLSSTIFITGSGPFEALFPYSLSVIPLFLMMGVFSARCGLSTDLFQAANTLMWPRSCTHHQSKNDLICLGRVCNTNFKR